MADSIGNERAGLWVFFSSEEPHMLMRFSKRPRTAAGKKVVDGVNLRERHWFLGNGKASGQTKRGNCFRPLLFLNFRMF